MRRMLAALTLFVASFWIGGPVSAATCVYPDGCSTSVTIHTPVGHATGTLPGTGADLGVIALVIGLCLVLGTMFWYSTKESNKR